MIEAQPARCRAATSRSTWRSRCPSAASPRCSARRAAARRRCCARWPGWSAPRAAWRSATRSGRTTRTRHFVPTHQRAIGYVIQEAALFPHLDVRAQPRLRPARASRPAQRRIALDQVVELLGIGPLLARRPDTLSGGERQRVAIARALATSPALLLMDEPLAALDAPRKAEMLPYLERLHEELAIPIVYVSHAIDEVARLADHLVLMDAGRVLADGPLADMLARLDLPLALRRRRRRGARRHRRRARCALAPGAARCRRRRLQPVGARPGPARSGRRVRAARAGARRQPGPRRRRPAPASATSCAARRGDRRRRTPGAGAGARARRARVPLVARLTRRSVHALGARVGMPVWAQVKTVALME